MDCVKCFICLVIFYNNFLKEYSYFVFYREGDKLGEVN